MSLPNLYQNIFNYLLTCYSRFVFVALSYRCVAAHSKILLVATPNSFNPEERCDRFLGVLLFVPMNKSLSLLWLNK